MRAREFITEQPDREAELIKKLGQLGTLIVQNPKLWAKYSAAIDNNNVDWIIALIQDRTGANKEEVTHLAELFGEIGGGLGRLVDFAWAVKEGTWVEDFVEPWTQYRNRGLAEAREGVMRNVLRRELPSWPDYVIKDWISSRVKNEEDLKNLIGWIRELNKTVQPNSWKLHQKMFLTFDMLNARSRYFMKIKRAFGDKNPFLIPRDRERLESATELVKTKGMENLPPVIMLQHANGLELCEGWHRTMAAFRLHPEGFYINAWIGQAVTQGVTEGAEQQYLWHGSRQKIPMLEPRQSVDTGGAVGSNQNAIYATSDPKVAIAMGLTTPDSDTAMFPNDPQMVLFSGKIRRGENVYLHKLPFYGPDGKSQFVKGAHDREFYSIPSVKGIKPVEIKAVPVDKYLNLIRQATPHDLELQKQFSQKQGVAEGFLNETLSDEAWELVGQPVPEIQQFVKQMGYGNDEQSVEKITAIIDKAPSTKIPAASIPKLKNLANKGNDAQTLKAIQQISGRPDAEQQYIKLMQARDTGENRNRDITGYIQYVKSGNYDPPVLLKLPTGVYVVGGRTRLYAALALGVPAIVKIISANSFKQGVAENFADGRKPGRKGLAKRVGVNCKQPVSKLRKIAKNSSGEKQRMAHWCANMKGGKKK
jgi:hypothetical protein